jgi:hypothetical protein
MNSNMRTDPDTETNSGYLLLFRGDDWDANLSTDELVPVMNRFRQWSENLARAGKVKGGQALARVGAVVSGKQGRSVLDGPFAEAKEAIGGYLWLKVDTFDEALAIARTSPGLDYGGTIEVRPILDECPVFKRIQQRLELARS